MDTMVIGNLCGDPKLRQTRRGDRPMARFTVAVNRWRRAGDELVACPPVFHRVICHGPLAENVNNSLRKGMEVLAVGQFVDDSYDDDRGERRNLIALEARTIGPGLRWATAAVVKAERADDQRGSPPGEPESGPEAALTGQEPELARAG